MKIYKSGIVKSEVNIQDTSYTNEVLNGEHTAFIEFDVLDPIGLEIDDYIEYLGQRYYIRHQENIKREETKRGFHYSVTLYHSFYKTHDIPFFLYEKVEYTEIMDHYMANAAQIMALVVWNMNRDDSGWSIGSVVETSTENHNFKDKTVAEVINDIVQRYDVEFWVEGKTLNIGRREYSSNGLVLSYNSGFRNIELLPKEQTPPVTRLHCYGGSKNITKEYGKEYLYLPNKAVYIEKNIEKYGLKGTKPVQFENIYPKGTFTISQTIDTFTFRASDIDFNLNDYFIKDTDAIITPQTGALAGYDFAISSFNDGAKEIKVKKNENEKAWNVPGDINFSVGDKFILTNIRMPQSYIDKAEAELLDKATKHLERICDKQVLLKCVCDEIYFRENNIFIGCGQLVGVSDNKLDISREIRCVAVKRFMVDGDESPYKYEITLSDFLLSNGIGTIFNQIKEIPNMIDTEINKIYQYTKRSWRDAEELYLYLQDSLLNFTEAINPVAVQTMQLLVGDNSLQFRFVNTVYSPLEIDHPFIWSDEGKTLSANASIIQHMTLGIDTLSPGHKPSEYKFWNIEPFNYQLLDQRPRWIYLRCSKSLNINVGTGKIKLSETAIKIDHENGYYHFLAGFLNSEYDGERSLVTLYGFTEITPGQIVTNRIRNADGTQYWDMLNSRFLIGNANSYLSYNVHAPEQLRLKGTIVQSPSGAEDYLEVDRGNWANYITYYPGDKVKASDGNVYKCISTCYNVTPPNSSFWKLIVSKGSDGMEGQGYMYAYYPTNSITPPARPTGSGGYTPSGWIDKPNIGDYKYIFQTQCIKSNGVWSSWDTPVLFNYTPPPGDPGPGLVYRGEFNSLPYPRYFYNNAIRRDAVKHNSQYWLYKGSDGGWRDTFNPSEWEPFGAQFSSVATGLLLAEMANVGGWIFKNQKLFSQGEQMFLDGVNGRISSNNDGNRLVMDSSDRSFKYINPNNEEIFKLYGREFQSSSYEPALDLKRIINGSMNYQTSYRAGFIDMRYKDELNVIMLSILDGIVNVVFKLDRFPDSRSKALHGGLYRDGETIKIRTSF